MISENSFASSYGSIWRSLLPNSEAAIGRLNKSLESLGRSSCAFSSPSRRALINEIAFGLFVNIKKPASSYAITADLGAFTLATERAIHQQEQFKNRGAVSLSHPSLVEKFEIFSIAKILELYRSLICNGKDMLAYPKFAGCGTLDECFGDFIIDDILVEVKAGDRNFRSIGIRQVLIYCALNSIQRGLAIRRVSCVNPRRGIYFVVDLDTLCLQFASSPAAEVLAELIYISFPVVRFRDDFFGGRVQPSVILIRSDCHEFGFLPSPALRLRIIGLSPRRMGLS